MLFKDICVCGHYKGKHGNDYNNRQNRTYMGGREGNKVKKEYSEGIIDIGKVYTPLFSSVVGKVYRTFLPEKIFHFSLVKTLKNERNLP